MEGKEKKRMFSLASRASLGAKAVEGKVVFEKKLKIRQPGSSRVQVSLTVWLGEAWKIAFLVSAKGRNSASGNSDAPYQRNPNRP